MSRPLRYHLARLELELRALLRSIELGLERAAAELERWRREL